MKARRIVVTTASVAVAALTLAGCSGSANSSEGKELTVMMSANGLHPEEQKAWFKKVSAEFEKQTGAKITFETFASANDELTAIQSSVLSGQGPDVYSLGTTFTPTAYSTGAFVELGDAEWDKVGGRDRFIPSLLGISGPSEDDQIGIPFASRPYVIAYNKDLLEAAGISEVPTTWDELTAAAKATTKGDTYGLAIGYADNYDPWKYVWSMSIQAGNELIDVDEKKAQLDDPTVVNAYQTYFGWYQAGLTDPASTGWKGAEAVAAFAAGKAAFLPMATAASQPTLDSSAVAGSYAYAVMPTVPPGATERPSDGKEAASILSGDNLVVAQYSSEQELAFELIKMLTSKKWQVEYFTTFGELPTTSDAAADVAKSNRDLSANVTAAEKSVATPFTGAWSDTQLALTNVVVQSVPALKDGKLTTGDIEKRVAEAEKTSQSSLDKAK